MKKTEIFFTLLCVLAIRSVLGQSGLPEYSFLQFLRPNDPQGAAMGMSGAAFRNGSLSPLTNPAGLAHLDRVELAFSEIPPIRISGLGSLLNQEALAIAVPLPDGFAAGMSFFNLNEGTPDFTGKDFGISQIQWTLAKQLSNLSIGASVKHVHVYPKFIVDESQWMFDIGARQDLVLISEGKPSGRISWGISVSDIGKGISGKTIGDSTSADGTPKFLRAGICGGTESLPSHENNSPLTYMVTAEFQHVLNAAHYKFDHLATGLELKFFEYGYTRVGYNFELRNKNKNAVYNYKGFTYGLGFETPEDLFTSFPVRLQLNYGRGVARGLVDVNIFSATLSYRLK